jgi:HD-GYP domain-containing protein (c-di-GMP phosphodiesterase class II)
MPLPGTASTPAPDAGDASGREARSEAGEAGRGLDEAEAEGMGPAGGAPGSRADEVKTDGSSRPVRPRTELMRKVDPGKTGMLRPVQGSVSGGLRRAHTDLATLYRVTNAINAHSEPHDLADALAQTVLTVLEADSAAVLLRNQKDGKPEPEVVRERGSDDPVPIEDAKVSRTVVSQVVSKGVSILSRNVQEDERYTGESLIISRTQSVMCVPLLAQSEVIGALYVDNRQSRDAFDEHDLELLAAIGNQAGVAIQRVGLLSELENLFFSSIRSLVAAVDRKDGYTHGHSERVTAFALKLGKALSMSEHEAEVLQLAGLLHDLGKIGVPERVLNKPGELTDEEFDEMKLHPVHGAEIISNIQSPYMSEIVPAVRYHHESWDGKGYPEGLKGAKTPLSARVLALADAFDAMTSDRPYRKGFSTERAAEIVRDCSGTQFDPELAKVFLRLHERGELILPDTMALKYTTMATVKPN